MASHRQIGFRLAAGTGRNGTAAYARGLRSYWDGNMTEALGAFDAAAAAEPGNALYQYYRALSFYNLQGEEAAADWLAQAVEMERQSPIKHWGRSMERVQGRARLWVEQARTSASLGR
jgi:tetratricopeptide (TPR) repeat protein